MYNNDGSVDRKVDPNFEMEDSLDVVDTDQADNEADEREDTGQQSTPEVPEDDVPGYPDVTVCPSVWLGLTMVKFSYLLVRHREMAVFAAK